jgi:glycosyltransferase involved in cell wall biosynthesis
MACGTPLLTSSVSSLPEVVGEAAIKINPLDVEAIGDGLQRLVEDSDLRSRLSSLGLAQARRFNWDKTAGETWQVLQEAAG